MGKSKQSLVTNFKNLVLRESQCILCLIGLIISKATLLKPI
jgi:hypothetical protein